MDATIYRYRGRGAVLVETDDPLSIDYDELATLKRLALDGALERQVLVSCSNLAEDLGVSNQTASRRLRHLDETGVIEREIVNDGQRIFVTGRGERVLRGEYDSYRRVFESLSGLDLRGTVEDGLGEGAEFIALDGYMEQFRSRLGYEPYHGTLNVGLTDEGVGARARMEAVVDPVWINGWEDGDRSFGPAFCYPSAVEAGGETYRGAHVIVPRRTRHTEDVIEVIAPDRLRDALDVDNGDEVTIHVER